MVVPRAGLPAPPPVPPPPSAPAAAYGSRSPQFGTRTVPRPPVALSRSAALPLWASTGTSPVGSPTMHPGGGAHSSGIGKHMRHALAARLFVIGQRDMDRRDQGHPRQFGHRRKHRRDIAFHVAGTAPDKPPSLTPQTEGICPPFRLSAGTTSTCPDRI